ncbi:MAG TPA: hypothetical protein V6C78_33725 [Crinalium sp.]|jgi:hypothetical protein
MSRSPVQLLFLILPFLIYAIVLWLPIPLAIGLGMRYSPAIALPVLLLLLYPVYRLSGWRATWVSLAMTLVLFALPLSGLWNSAASEYPVLMGGLFPLTDGSNYYVDARRLLEGGRFDAVSSGRPLFAGVFAVLLGLTQQNVQLSLAIVVAIVAIACFLLAREVQQSHGVLAGLAVMATLFLFYRRFAGSAWTESLGLTLGAIATALLWRSAHQKQRYWFVSGLFLLTLALNARAGAFFVLPVLGLWGSWFFRGKRRVSVAIALGSMAAIGLGFFLNYLVLSHVGRADVAFSNLSFTIYAQVVGSKDWRQVGIDYPEVLKLDQPEITYRIYELAWQEFLKHPLRLFGSFIEALATYLSPTPYGLFGFVSTYGITIASVLVIVLIYAISLVGLVRCLRDYKTPCHSLLIATGLGILCSIPLAPPWMDGVPSSLRAYAATLPFSALLPALGIAGLGDRPLDYPKRQPFHARSPIPVTFLFGVFLVLLSIAGPLVTKALSHPPSLVEKSCPAEQQSVYTRFSPGSWVQLVEDTDAVQTHLPMVRVGDFRPGTNAVVQTLANRRSLVTDETREIANLSAGYTVIDALNLQTHRRLWVVMKSDKRPQKTGMIQVCGHLQNNVLYADSIR